MIIGKQHPTKEKEKEVLSCINSYVFSRKLFPLINKENTTNVIERLSFCMIKNYNSLSL